MINQLMKWFVACCNWVLSNIIPFLDSVWAYIKDYIPDAIVPAVSGCLSLLSAVNQWVPLDYLFYLAVTYCAIMFVSWLVHRIFDVIP